MEKEIVCISCPLGCQLTVKANGPDIDSITGFSCTRGKEYGRKEFSNPERIFTSSVKVIDGGAPIVSVRSAAPIPKELIMKCAELVRNVKAKAPVRINDIIIDDILGTGISLVATANVNK